MYYLPTLCYKVGRNSTNLQYFSLNLPALSLIPQFGFEEIYFLFFLFLIAAQVFVFFDLNLSLPRVISLFDTTDLEYFFEVMKYLIRLVVN